jgi:hypothetical protein
VKLHVVSPVFGEVKRKLVKSNTVHRGGGAKKIIELYTKSIVVNIVN